MMEQQIETIERQGTGYSDLPKIDYDSDAIARYDKEVKFYKAIVLDVLKNTPECTSNDFILYIEVLRSLSLMYVTSGTINYHFTLNKDDLKNVPSPETITRIRRALISEAIKKDNFELFKRIIPQNKSVLIARLKKEKVMRDYYNRSRLE